MSSRLNRLREEIKKEVSFIVQRKVKDPRLGFLSITDVDLSRDYSYCKIFVSVLGSDEQKEQTMIGLKKATGFVRSELAKKLRLRGTPHITFLLDPSIEYGSRINEILKDLNVDGESDHE